MTVGFRFALVQLDEFEHWQPCLASFRFGEIGDGRVTIVIAVPKVAV